MAPRKNHWIENGWGVEACSVDQVMRIVARIGTLQRDQRFVWRGVADATWSIRSSLQVAIGKGIFDDLSTCGLDTDQDALRSIERRILDGAHHWGLGVSEGSVLPDLQLLALLQHHGAPTRLIDVTSDPMTALWFACQSPASLRGATQEDISGGLTKPKAPAKRALFAFNVTPVASVSTVEPLTGVSASFQDQAAASLDLALMHSQETGNPVLLTPTIQDARMAAQQGRFLLGVEPESRAVPGIVAFPFQASSAPGKDGLEELMKPAEKGRGRPRKVDFVAIIFPESVRVKLLDHLRGSYNKSASTMYPDLHGYVDALRGEAFNLSDVPRRGHLDELAFNPQSPAAAPTIKEAELTG